MLDHKWLNKIEALGAPTLENLTRSSGTGFSTPTRGHVSVHRDSCGESCAYFGPQD